MAGTRFRGAPRRGPRRGNYNQAPSRTSNTYMTLAALVDEEAGELNAHLTERLTSRFSSEGDSNPRAQFIPMAGPLKSNEDIRKYFEDADKPVAGGNWLSKPEVPSPAELTTPQVTGKKEQIISLEEELRPNKIEGAYESNEEYLGTQYDLLREDAIRPLREAIEKVRGSPWLDESEYEGGGIGVYDPVYITSLVFANRGLATRVAFSLSRVKKHVRWDQSKRLITGSLVALSPADDCFQHKCVLATVAARPLAALDQNPPEIDLFFDRPESMEIDPMRKWIMVESRSSFYEASRHTLLALQHMMREPFPLSEHLVRAQTNVEPPSYVQKNPYTDMSSLVTMEEEDAFRNVNILEEWPSNASHGLDTSQSRALKRILTSRLAVIQGPPGTGKTYSSVVALKILLSNMGKDDPPVIVTCQTNHALDQLLRHVAEFEPNFIRLGGRSKDKDKIKKRTLHEVRSSFSQPPKTHSNLKTRAITEIKKITNQMQMHLTPLEAGKPPLDHRVLLKLGLITEEQSRSLEVESMSVMGIQQDDLGIQMEQWLGKCLVPCARPIQPDDFGMEFEEEDFEVEQLQELEAEAVAQDDDFETLKGPVTLLSDNQTGKAGNVQTDEEIRDLLRRSDDLTTIPVPDRGPVYNYFQRQAKQILLKDFRVYAKQYKNAVRQRQVGQWEQDFRFLADQRIVGMTTTGLSKYRGLVAALRPKIILVEEAAEILEAPVTVACLPTLEHLILVGDHEQLRPHCQIRDFEDAPYHFNVSLFERMVSNNIDMARLTRQRRMIPEIRRLLEPIYGNVLKDHANVTNVANRPPVEGMGGTNTFFFTHEWPESRDANMSCMNEKEADMVVGLFDYLVMNGVEPDKITVLTFYNGQRKAIIRRLRHHRNFRCQPTLNVVTVDSYQGEENDIVLLSLVRSNRKHSIGFLEVDNRVCVALSRAKRGFYLFGNAELLACQSDTWAEVVEIMYGKKSSGNPKTGQKRRVGYKLPLQCTNHQRKIWIEEPDVDWELINGGCDALCRCTLPCGHKCLLRCHPFHNSLINCTQRCGKRLETCGHPCSVSCGEPCKCQLCERRNDGTRAVLKHQPNGIHARRHAPVLVQEQPMRAPSPITEHSGSSVDKWKAYATGGAEADDAKYIQQLQEEDAKYREQLANGKKDPSPPRLIEMSPAKQPANENLAAVNHLLVDLDMGATEPSSQSVSGTTYASIASTSVNKKKGKSQRFNLNLMD